MVGVCVCKERKRKEIRHVHENGNPTVNQGKQDPSFRIDPTMEPGNNLEMKQPPGNKQTMKEKGEKGENGIMCSYEKYNFMVYNKYYRHTKSQIGEG